MKKRILQFLITVICYIVIFLIHDQLDGQDLKDMVLLIGGYMTGYMCLDLTKDIKPSQKEPIYYYCLKCGKQKSKEGRHGN